MAVARGRERALLLVGGGHAHALVLRALARNPLPRTRITLLSDAAFAVYSGMVPGVLAGEYAPEEARIDLAALAAMAGARFVVAPAVRLSAAARVVETRGAGLLPFDVASLDVGASVSGLEVPGVGALALATRPMRTFLDALTDLVARAKAREGPVRGVVVGGGAAGVELAGTLRGRLLREGLPHASVSLLEASPRLMGDRGAAVSAAVIRALRRRGIEVETGVRVAAAREGGLILAGGGERPFDILLWATGAAAPALARSTDLSTDGLGFVRVGRTLEVVGSPGIFAAGDVASHDAHPTLPRCGVHAVRQAPVLAYNLRACLEGRPLRRFRPQRDFLVLLNLGDGRALGVRHGRAFEGRLVHRLKDRIDRRFLARFPTALPPGVRAL